MTPAPLPCARTVAAGVHDAALFAWQAAGVTIPEMAQRLRCSRTTIGNRLTEIRRASGLSKRKPNAQTVKIKPPSDAVLNRLPPKARAAWDAALDNPDSATLGERMGCRPGTARVRLYWARRIIAAGASA